MSKRKSAPASVRAASNRPMRAGANVIPLGMGLANAGFITLLVSDLGTLGGLLNHWVLLIGKNSEALQAAGGSGNIAHNGGSFIGLLFGIELGMIYLIFPMQFIAGRTPVAVKAYRLLCRIILIIHLPLMLALVLDYIRQPSETFFFVFLSAPVSLLGTPFLYPIWRVLRMRWLDLSAPPRDWEPMPGIDGGVKRDGPAPEATAMWVAILLPFVAAARARRPGLAAMAFLLWAGAIVMLFMDPLRAVIPFALASGLGRYVAGTVGLPSQPTAPPPNLGEREKRLREVFIPARLIAPPKFQTVGLLALPLLFVLGALALVIWFGLVATDSVEALGGLVEGWGILLLVINPLVLITAQSITPLGNRLGRLVYRCLGGVVVLAHLAATAFFAAVSLHLQAPGNRPPLQSLVEPMLLPLTLALLATLPLAIVLALSLPARPVNLLTIYDRA